MGIISYIGEKMFYKSVESTSGFSTTKFILIAGGISLIMFGAGYMFTGLGSAITPISNIIDELHDSEDSQDEKIYKPTDLDTSDDAEESNETSN
jgi:hypothetical protein